MKKLLLILLIPFLMGAAPTRQKDYTNGEIILDTDVESNENVVFNYLQAGVDTYATDSIKDTHIDWGTSGTQVSQDDVVDGGTYKQYNPASVAITGGSITGITDLAVADGGTGASTLSDGFVLLGNGTSAIQTLDVTGNGSIIIGDGTTDPTTLSAFTNSTGTLKHEYGGLEADVSGYTNGLYGQLTGATANIDTSSEIISAISDETGTGNLVFSASPTLTGTITAASMNASGTISGVVVSASSALQVGSDYISDITGSGLSISGGALKVTTTGESTTVSDTTTINLTLTGSDITADGLYTAGDALTLTGADFDFDGGATPGGELGNTWASPTIDDSVAVTSWNLTTPTITTSATMTDGATIGQAAGPLLAFDDTNNYFEMTGGNVGIGTTVPNQLLDVQANSIEVADNTITFTDVTDGWVLTFDTGTNTWAGEAGGAGGASTTLNNLGSVAVNTDIISDTDSTDSLGSSTISWANVWADNFKQGTATALTIDNDGQDQDIVMKTNDGGVEETVFQVNGATGIVTTAQQSGCSVRLDADQDDLTDGTPTKVTFTIELFDTQAEFDNATNYRFTALVAGKYAISGQVTFENTDMVADRGYVAQIYKNGVELFQTQVHSSFGGGGGSWLTLPVSGIVTLAVSDYIELFARSDSGTNTIDINGGAVALGTYLSIVKVQ